MGENDCDMVVSNGRAVEHAVFNVERVLFGCHVFLLLPHTPPMK